jgi:hypothetical protein
LNEVYRLGYLEKMATNDELIRTYLEALHDDTFLTFAGEMKP